MHKKKKYQIQNQQQIVQNIYINITYIHLNKMNKEEFMIDEKTYENHEGLKIKIVFSNLRRWYKKIYEHLYLILEKKN